MDARIPGGPTATGVTCDFASDADTKGYAVYGHLECACARGCGGTKAFSDCGVWKETTECNCDSGCACGGYFPKDFMGKPVYNDYFAIGTTPKGGSECSLNDFLGLGVDAWYKRVPTTVIGVCAGAN